MLYFNIKKKSIEMFQFYVEHDLYVKKNEYLTLLFLYFGIKHLTKEQS